MLITLKWLFRWTLLADYCFSLVRLCVFANLLARRAIKTEFVKIDKRAKHWIIRCLFFIHPSIIRELYCIQNTANAETSITRSAKADCTARRV